MNEKLLKYFNQDELAAIVWKGKYATKDEETPNDMHRRLANEFAKIEKQYGKTTDPQLISKLSEFGKWFEENFWNDNPEESIFKVLEDFKYVIPQGSIMSILGNKYKVGSLSNCFVVSSPYDSYGGILKTDEELAQLMKRRGGVGTNLNTLRPTKSPVSNASESSTGAQSFMHRFSNTTREVAQEGRRGALMLLLLVLHPDIFKFVSIKDDRTQVTGANISVMLTDEFLKAVEKDDDFICRFPVTFEFGEAHEELLKDIMKNAPYNEIINAKDVQVMKIKARELFDLIIEMAWKNAEPGLAFIDRVNKYSPDGVYYYINKCNPCGK